MCDIALYLHKYFGNTKDFGKATVKTLFNKKYQNCCIA